jgi:formate hydrogenlyase subunit 4
MNDVLLWLAQILLVPILSPLGIGIINKLKAKMQKRQGASILQPYRNLSKLFHKDEVISEDASWLFRMAPFLIFAVTIIIGASIPLFTTVLHAPTSDMFMIVCLFALETFFLALAGMDVGGAFGGFGSSREMTMSAFAEGAFVFSIAPLALLMGTTNLTAIVGGMHNVYAHSLPTILLAFAGFVVVLLVETKRYPFDNPDTHLELTMIHEAMLLEYSGKRLALMEWSAANKLFIFASLAVNLFFGLGIAHSSSLQAVLIGISALLAGVGIVFCAIALLESTLAKLRFFRLPDLIFTALILNIVAIGLIS